MSNEQSDKSNERGLIFNTRTDRWWVSYSAGTTDNQEEACVYTRAEFDSFRVADGCEFQPLDPERPSVPSSKASSPVVGGCHVCSGSARVYGDPCTLSNCPYRPIPQDKGTFDATFSGDTHLLKSVSFGAMPSARVFAPEGWKLVQIEGNGQSEREAMSALVLRGLIRLRANAAWKEFSDKQYGFGGEDEKQAFLDAVTSAFVKAPLPTHTIGTVDLSDPQAAERVLDKMAIESPRAWNDVNAEAISILIQRAGGELFIPNGPDIKVGTTFARVEEGGVRFRFSPKGSQ